MPYYKTAAAGTTLGIEPGASCYNGRMAKHDSHIKPIATNKQARRNYHISETFEAGLELRGTEVKSLRAAKVQLRDAYAKIVDGEVWLHNCHISPYKYGNIYNHE